MIGCKINSTDEIQSPFMHTVSKPLLNPQSSIKSETLTPCLPQSREQNHTCPPARSKVTFNPPKGIDSD